MLKNIREKMKPYRKNYVVICDNNEVTSSMITALSRVKSKDYDWDNDIIIGYDGLFKDIQGAEMIDVMTIRINRRGDEKLKANLELLGYKIVSYGRDGFMTKLERIQ